MKNSNALKNIKNKELIFSGQELFSLTIKTSELINIENIILEKDVRVNILLLDDSPIDLKVTQRKGTHLDFKIFNKNEINNSNITFDLHSESELNVIFADFSHGKAIEKITVNLLAKRAKCHWWLSSVSSDKDNKEFKVYINHLAPETEAIADSYGVAKHASRLIFSGTSHVVNGAKRSKTRQNANIMVFSKEADALAKPILEIDENDLEASHSATLGQVNEEHLFYLRSRGINENEAKTLIVMGYLTPILKKIENEDIKQEIESLILARI